MRKELSFHEIAKQAHKEKNGKLTLQKIYVDWPKGSLEMGLSQPEHTFDPQ